MCGYFSHIFIAFLLNNNQWNKTLQFSFSLILIIYSKKCFLIATSFIKWIVIKNYNLVSLKFWYFIQKKIVIATSFINLHLSSLNVTFCFSWQLPILKMISQFTNKNSFVYINFTWPVDSNKNKNYKNKNYQNRKIQANKNKTKLKPTKNFNQNLFFLLQRSQPWRTSW